MAHFRSETDGWNFGFGRTRTRGRFHDAAAANSRDQDNWVARPPPFMLAGMRPPFGPGDYWGRYYWDYDHWEDFERGEPRPGGSNSGGNSGSNSNSNSGGGGDNNNNNNNNNNTETAVVRSSAVIPAPKAAPDASRFDITVRDTTDNRLPAWPDNTCWKASIAKNLTIPVVIKHITSNPGKYMVTVVWSNNVEEELHDRIKLVDVERDALELRVRERQPGPPSMPRRAINAA
ncbi:hypothetical protein E4U41_005305 [Claviceps citrina]|nr:hypothetical protein E4U41_005305 [Claviceps citrina]